MARLLLDETLNLSRVDSQDESWRYRVSMLDDGTLVMTRHTERFDRRYGHNSLVGKSREAWLGSSDVRANLHPTLTDQLEDALEAGAA